MSKLKTTFITAKNDCYNNQRGIINIIGKQTENRPYLSITIQEKGNEIACTWVEDKDLERLAVNILKCLGSKVNAQSKDTTQAVEGATPVVRQNEQTKEVCPHDNVGPFSILQKAVWCYDCHKWV